MVSGACKMQLVNTLAWMRPSDSGEAATLAGMLKGPGIYNPIDYIDNATARRNTVLQLMVDNKTISRRSQSRSEC